MNSIIQNYSASIRSSHSYSTSKNTLTLSVKKISMLSSHNSEIIKKDTIMNLFKNFSNLQIKFPVPLLYKYRYEIQYNTYPCRYPS